MRGKNKNTKNTRADKKTATEWTPDGFELAFDDTQGGTHDFAETPASLSLAHTTNAFVPRESSDSSGGSRIFLAIGYEPFVKRFITATAMTANRGAVVRLAKYALQGLNSMLQGNDVDGRLEMRMHKDGHVYDVETLNRIEPTEPPVTSKGRPSIAEEARARGVHVEDDTRQSITRDIIEKAIRDIDDLHNRQNPNDQDKAPERAAFFVTTNPENDSINTGILFFGDGNLLCNIARNFVRALNRSLASHVKGKEFEFCLNMVNKQTGEILHILPEGQPMPVGGSPEDRRRFVETELLRND